MKSSLGAHHLVLPTAWKLRRSALERIRAAVPDVLDNGEVDDVASTEALHARRETLRRSPPRKTR